jgi:hypothetical protein
MRYSFKTTIFSQHIPSDPTKHIEVFAGTVDAESLREAKTMVKSIVYDRVQQLRKERDLLIGQGEPIVEALIAGAPMTDADLIVAMLQRMRGAAQNNIITASLHLETGSKPQQRSEYAAQIWKASIQASLLQNILAEIDGQESTALWQQ